MRDLTKIIECFSKGEMVIVVDDDDRENEGDLIVAAVHCTPEKMAFIVRHTSGIVCTPLPIEEARRLRLDPMVVHNDSAHSTAFTVTIDYKHGTTTGISAEDRTATCRALANPNVGAADFTRPGHIFPLIAREGGVLMRSGHTEAAVDLCKLANLPPIGVICEMVNDDGSVMRGEQIKVFAAKHNLKILSVADLITYRQSREKLVERLGEMPIETPFGVARGLAYKTPFDKQEHLALVFGEIDISKPVYVRLERENLLRDVFGKRDSLNKAMQKLNSEGGVLLYLREGTAGVVSSSLLAQEEHDTAKSREKEWREIGLGAQILRDLRISEITLLSNNTRRFIGLEAFGITIANHEGL